jgi:hypothetical protein
METILRFIGRALIYLANAIHNVRNDVESYLFDLIFVDDHSTKIKLASHNLPISSKPTRKGGQ